MSKPSDSKRILLEYETLKSNHAILLQETEDLRHQLTSLKKELQIWKQVSDQQENRSLAREKMLLLENQNTHLKTQLVNCLTEKNTLSRVNEELMEKVNDLKYNNGELKSLNDKLSSLQTRELDVVQRNSEERERNHQKEKESLEKRLENCSSIVREMEDYYVQEINKRNELLQDREDLIRQLTHKSNKAAQDLQCCRAELAAEKEGENHKWQIRFQEMNVKYDEDVAELREKVKFLVLKLENRLSETTMAAQESLRLDDSKRNMSNSTEPPVSQPAGKLAQSYKANSHFAPSIKESLSRRSTNIVRTPNKVYQRGILHDRSNL